MTNQQGAPEAPKVRTADYEAGWKDGYKQGAWAAQQPAPKASQQAAPSTDQVEEILRERDDADDFIDALLDEVLGPERPEWSSAYGRADALNDVRERMTALHKPAVDKAWDRFQSAMEAPQQPAPSPVPAGWNLVPTEPTQAMLDAVVTSMDDFLLGKEAEKQYREDWAAMLAAAPAQSVAEQTKSADMSDEREAFEAWLRSIWSAGYGCPKFDSGKYVHHEAQRFWECWQASASHGQAPAQPEAAPIAWRILRKNHLTKEWVSDELERFSPGVPPQDLIDSVAKHSEMYRLEYAYATTSPNADSVLEDAMRYRWLAAHCRSTSEHWGGRWSIVVDGPAPKSHDSEDDFDAAVDSARKQGEKQ